MSKPGGLLWVLLWLAAAGCDGSLHSSAGFRLPPGGNVERGQATFLAFGCNQCHEVSGVTLPKPTIEPPVPVVLGGETERAMTDGYLVTSIVNPSYQLAPYPKDQITSAGESRMPHFADRLTIQDLADLVAFLQPQYKLSSPLRQPYY